MFNSFMQYTGIAIRGHQTQALCFKPCQSTDGLRHGNFFLRVLKKYIF